MPDNSSLCETILASRPPSQMSALSSKHCNIQKCHYTSLYGQRPEDKEGLQCGWRQESKEKDKQPIPIAFHFRPFPVWVFCFVFCFVLGHMEESPSNEDPSDQNVSLSSAHNHLHLWP